jgi:hypothetical protein
LCGGKKGAPRDVYTEAGRALGSAPTTVKSVLRRLVEEGHLTTTQVGNSFLYRPAESAVKSSLAAADALLDNDRGHCVAPPDDRFRLKPPETHEPKNMTVEQRRIWYETWALTDEGRAWQQYERDSRFYGFRVEADGSFRIDDVVAGTYELVLKALDAPNGRVIAAAARTLVVPEMPGGHSDQPLDLGTLEMLSVP